MAKEFEISLEGELPATPEAVWAAITRRRRRAGSGRSTTSRASAAPSAA